MEPSSLFSTPISSIVAIVIDCFLVSHMHLYLFILSVQSVKTNIFLVDLYSTEHEYIFLGMNHHLFSVGFCSCTNFFVYFEYNQIFIFSLHSMAADALNLNISCSCEEIFHVEN